MKTVEILGANRFETYTKTREGSRAIIVKDGKILLTHELKSGWWLLPGGGMEAGETPEDCVIREVEEETGKGRMNLTDVEKQRGVQPEWISLQDAIDLFSKHESYAEESEEKRGSYQREYMALCEYMKIND